MSRAIPVNRAPRTFAQLHRNRLSNLEKSVDRRDAANGDANHEPLPLTTWPMNWDNWLDHSWRNLDRELESKFQNMFALLPVESLGLDTWGGLHTIPDPLDLIHRMERDVEDVRRRMGASFGPQSGALSDFMKDAYEVGEDGKVNFVARFGVDGFTPDDISVTSTDKQLCVHAKKAIKDSTSKTCREFCRIIHLPERIDNNGLRCHLTQDGVLCVEAPVNDADHHHLALTDGGRLAIRPKSEDQMKQLPESKQLTVQGLSEPTVLDDEVKGRNLQVEVPIDPSFKLDDIHVSVGAHKINVHGKRINERHDQSAHGKFKSAAEFNCSYEIPETVDPLTVSTGLVGNTLVIRAPLSRTHKVMMDTSS